MDLSADKSRMDAYLRRPVLQAGSLFSAPAGAPAGPNAALLAASGAGSGAQCAARGNATAIDAEAAAFGSAALPPSALPAGFMDSNMVDYEYSEDAEAQEEDLSWVFGRRPPAAATAGAAPPLPAACPGHLPPQPAAHAPAAETLLPSPPARVSCFPLSAADGSTACGASDACIDLTECSGAAADRDLPAAGPSEVSPFEAAADSDISNNDTALPGCSTATGFELSGVDVHEQQRIWDEIQRSNARRSAAAASSPPAVAAGHAGSQAGSQAGSGRSTGGDSGGNGKLGGRRSHAGQQGGSSGANKRARGNGSSAVQPAQRTIAAFFQQASVVSSDSKHSS